MALILIIDDDATVRATVRKILERAGHEVRDAGDGDRGLTIFREEDVDLVITDIIMPEKEGIETIQELRETDPDLPILAISGGGRADPSEPLTDARLLGADETLAKPFDVDELRKTVERLLEGREG